MSNFEFLKQEWSSIYKKMKKAEERINTEPVSTANYCRLILEECMHLLHDLEFIDLPYNKELVNLMEQEEIKAIVPYHHLTGLHIVRKTGNNAAHYGNRVNPADALVSIKYLYGFLKWFAGNYSQEVVSLPGIFDMNFVPKIGAQKRQLKELEKERSQEQDELLARVEALQKANEAALEKARESEEALARYTEKEKEAKAVLKKQKEERLIEVPSEYNEAQTRKNLIDVNLKEAGWYDLKPNYHIEYPVKGMPVNSDNPKGNGFVDYVLWDNVGKPLAIIEAKRTTKAAEVGKHQAFLYANCLEEMHGQRPVIFYSNGYETNIWDDTFYSAPRRVYGFYTKDELLWMIQKRKTRTDIRLANPNADIAGRPYQIEAIKRVADSFVVKTKDGLRGDMRSALLVMATGSGKTRTAAALVDLLIKNNWIKRVLFLADRNALVRQAKRNFGEYLTNLSSVDLTEDKEQDGVRLIFSTYPTMMHRIDNVSNSDERFYGVGHFDLIIVDEAHRSIYSKYKAIFEYFDSLVVGLTATPKESIDHNTFELFGCPTKDPTFNYDLEQAVPKYLTPYNNQDVSTEFIREGIKYSELSEEDKKQYEETFMDKTTGLFPEEIEASQMNKKLFNIDTVNKVLDTVMEEGLKIEGGDKIGRTIIFAVNQNHAQFIVECFEKRYPDKPAGFIASIHNKVSHSQSLIDSFCDHFNENLPQIAVSVDMMDTGIDAPRVLNLVFFKVVRSYAKFWQMIGRGTRLCPDVFGPGQKKTEFLIFDVCMNFEFFGINKNGKESTLSKPITQLIFESRLQLSRLLAETGEADNIALSSELLDILHAAIKNLDRSRFQVNMNLRYVDDFKDRARWNNLSADDVHQIETHLSDLPSPEKVNEVVRRFDLMMLKLQIATHLKLNSEKGFHEKLIGIAERLSEKYTIPQVLRSTKLIENLKDPNFYSDLKQRRLNEIREEIRELVQYLESREQEPFYTNFTDSKAEVKDGATIYNTANSSLYKKRVEAYIRENRNLLVISKLNTNLPITEDELKQLETVLFDGADRGSIEDFQKTYGNEPLGKFVRSIIGLEVTAAQEAFATFLQSGNFTANQITFIQKIIEFLSTNGTIDKRMLFESPFTDSHQDGVSGIFDDGDAVRIISIIDTINANAGVA